MMEFADIEKMLGHSFWWFVISSILAIAVLGAVLYAEGLTDPTRTGRSPPASTNANS